MPPAPGAASKSSNPGSVRSTVAIGAVSAVFSAAGVACWMSSALLLAALSRLRHPSGASRSQMVFTSSISAMVAPFSRPELKCLGTTSARRQV